MQRTLQMIRTVHEDPWENIFPERLAMAVV